MDPAIITKITLGKSAKNKFDHLYTAKNGYVKTVMKSDKHGWRDVYLHEIVAITFVPNPHNYTKVRHIDGDKQNNKATNLEWVEVANY
jgi:hypothetical protein